MPQAIMTKYIPCSMRAPARVKATGSGNALGAKGAPFVIVPYYSDADEHGEHYWPHKRAAEAFARRYKWSGRWYGQETREGWIFINEPRISFSVPRDE